jgi:hypothetical protein
MSGNKPAPTVYGETKEIEPGRCPKPVPVRRGRGVECARLRIALARGLLATFPETKRLMRQIAATYEEMVGRLEREAGAADKS